LQPIFLTHFVPRFWTSRLDGEATALKSPFRLSSRTPPTTIVNLARGALVCQSSPNHLPVEELDQRRSGRANVVVQCSHSATSRSCVLIDSLAPMECLASSFTASEVTLSQRPKSPLRHAPSLPISTAAQLVLESTASGARPMEADAALAGIY
jgi:hypothetical protein